MSRGPELKLSTKSRVVPVTMALAGTIALAACGASNESGNAGAGGGNSSAPQLSGSLNGAGSTAQTAAMQGWSAGFSAVQPKVTVNYDAVGSGAGRTQFLAGGVAFAGSDSPLSDDEVTQAKTRCGTDGVFELPNYISAIAVVYNLPGVDKLSLKPDTIAKIFAGSIKKWNDPAIAADNSGAKLPDTAIAPVHRSDKSGTTKNFTDYLSKAAPSAWTKASADTWPFTSGEAANGTSGVVNAVKNGTGTIGYADESQAKGLGIADIGVGSTFVAPSPAAAAKVVESSQVMPGRGKYDFAYTINRTTTSADEYPIVLVSYHIGCVQNKDKTTADILKSFEGYVISPDGQQAAAKAAGSAPITDAVRAKSQTAVDAITAGA
ncbi:MAG: Extra-cellular phosphate-binding protein [Blastococcus sp.]|jgi:phosphate transport system substrate-binding protein|nr:Extra-cellular phosphate-binding protein [Blastococcus sp.]